MRWISCQAVNLALIINLATSIVTVNFVCLVNVLVLMIQLMCFLLVIFLGVVPSF